jgi:membrane peptidoglycan carboxypeptidase
MMAAYAAVANGGVLVKPQICEKIVDCEGKIVENHEGAVPVRRVISQETARRLGAMLKAVVDSGTGGKAAVAGLSIAGKTGTSQKLDSGTYSKTRSYASFIGYLPLERPCLLVGVVIDEPADNLMGGTAAAPLFRKIITQVMSHPDLEYAELILKDRPRDRTVVAAGMASPAAAAVAAAAPERRAAVKDTAKSGRMVPDCVGRDARDAVNLINARGMVPYLVGSGIVRRQNPSAGSTVSAAQPCTLVCSFGG